VPWLYNASSGCTDSFGPAPDGLFDYSEMHWLVWLAHESVCGPEKSLCSSSTPVETLWRAWEGRADQPNYMYAERELLTLWPSYVVQLPFYLVHPFVADKRFTDLFAKQVSERSAVRPPLSTCLSVGLSRYLSILLGGPTHAADVTVGS
jgi:hypothetical protein